MMHAPPATAAASVTGATAPPVLIPRLQLSSWGAATEDEQTIYGAKPRLSNRQAIAAAKDEAAAIAAATAAAANVGRSAGGWSPRGTVQQPRSSTSPSASRAAAAAHPVSQLHLSPGRRVSVSPSGRGQRSSVSPSGRTVTPTSRAAPASVGLSPRGSAGTGSSPRGGNVGVSPRGAAAGSSPRGVPPGTQQRFYSHALRQTPMQQPQPQQHPYAQSPRSPPESRSYTMAAAAASGRLSDSHRASSSLSSSAAGDDLLRRLSELEVDLRARLHSLHVEFEGIKGVRAQRDALQDQLDNLEAALTSFPFASEIRVKLINILRANGTGSDAAAAAAKDERQRRSELRQTDPLPEPSPIVLAARAAAADSASLVHTAPDPESKQPSVSRMPASARAQPVSANRPPSAPVPVAMFVLPSFPASAASTSSHAAASSAPSASATLRADEYSQQVDAEPKHVRRSVGAASAPPQPAPSPPPIDHHPHLASSLSSSSLLASAAAPAAGPSIAAGSSLVSSLNASFPVQYAPLATDPIQSAASTQGASTNAGAVPAAMDDPLDKLIVFPPPRSKR